MINFLRTVNSLQYGLVAHPKEERIAQLYSSQLVCGRGLRNLRMSSTDASTEFFRWHRRPHHRKGVNPEIRPTLQRRQRRYCRCSCVIATGRRQASHLLRWIDGREGLWRWPRYCSGGEAGGCESFGKRSGGKAPGAGRDA